MRHEFLAYLVLMHPDSIRHCVDGQVQAGNLGQAAGPETAMKALGRRQATGFGYTYYSIGTTRLYGWQNISLTTAGGMSRGTTQKPGLAVF